MRAASPRFDAGLLAAGRQLDGSQQHIVVGGGMDAQLTKGRHLPYFGTSFGPPSLGKPPSCRDLRRRAFKVQDGSHLRHHLL